MIEEHEEWRPLMRKGFENLYEISNLGRVRRIAEGLKAMKLPYYLTSSKRGESVVYGVNNSAGRVQIFAGKEVLRSFKGLDVYRVLYKDGDRSNIRLSNLDYIPRYVIDHGIVKDAPLTVPVDKSTPLPFKKTRSCNKSGDEVSACRFYPCFEGQPKFKTDFGAAGCFRYKARD